MNRNLSVFTLSSKNILNEFMNMSNILKGLFLIAEAFLSNTMKEKLQDSHLFPT